MKNIIFDIYIQMTVEMERLEFVLGKFKIIILHFSILMEKCENKTRKAKNKTLCKSDNEIYEFIKLCSISITT
jgi:hypothetical protein